MAQTASALYPITHAAVIPTGPYRGQVLCLADAQASQPPAAGPWPQRWLVLDPVNDRYLQYTLTIPSAPASSGGDLFCSGHSWTADGRLFVAGGTRQYPASAGGQGNYVGARLAFIFDPALINPDPTAPGAGNAPWLPQPDMVLDRWYPSVTLLSGAANDHLIVTGGYTTTPPTAPTPNSPVFHNSYEAFQPGAGVPGTWQTFTTGLAATIYFPNGTAGSSPNVLAGPPQPNPIGYSTIGFIWYPRQFLLPDGTVFMCGEGNQSARLRHPPPPLPVPPATGPLHWTFMDIWDAPCPPNPTIQLAPEFRREYGSAVLYPIGPNFFLATILAGRVGTTNPGWPIASCATNSVEICIPTNTAAGAAPLGFNWQAGPSLVNPRVHQNAVLLAEGSLLVVGGEAVFGGGGTLPNELYSQGSFQFASNSNQLPASSRLYHSVALLLPDATVLSAGGEGRLWDYQVFVPPYLTAPILNNPLERPSGVVAPSQIGFNQEFTITCNALLSPRVVAKATLVRPASVTHHFDFDQRVIELVSDQAPQGNAITVFSPAPGTAPRGWYMLFLVTDVGVPSVAAWVNLQ